MGQLAPAGTNKNRQYLGVCGWGKDDSQRCRAGTWSQLQVATLSLPKKWTSVFRSRQNRVSNTLSLFPPSVFDHAHSYQREHSHHHQRRDHQRSLNSSRATLISSRRASIDFFRSRTSSFVAI